MNTHIVRRRNFLPRLAVVLAATVAPSVWAFDDAAVMPDKSAQTVSGRRVRAGVLKKRSLSSPSLGSGFESYTVVSLGAVDGLPSNYGGLIFEQGDPNTLLIGGAANDDNAAIYAVPVVRDASTHHVTGFGTASLYADAPYIDGGLLYTPNGGLIFTEYPVDRLGEISPGGDYGWVAAPLGNGSPGENSLGTFQFVPSGFNGAGNFIIATMDQSDYCVSSLTLDGSTYDVGTCSASSHDPNNSGPEGIVYVAAGSTGFTSQKMLVAEWTIGRVSVYSPDSNGMPDFSTRSDFVTGLNGAEGATVDPLTGDFFFSTFSNQGSANGVWAVQGFQPPAPIAPGAPTGVSATAGNASATVSFSPPGSDGGATITSYTATSNPGNFSASGSGSPLIVTGLANGTAYTFTVTATNSAGTGTASSASNSVTPAMLPGAPTIGTATAGNASASVSFTAPVSNGGATITNYTVTSNPGSVSNSGVGSPITVTGLTNGTAYTFTVTATNGIGIGPASAASNSVTPAGVPGAPAAVSATPGDTTASVSFTAPANNGAAITSYTVTSSPGGHAGTGASSPITVSGLTDGTAYTFTVTATNSVGTGPASSASNSVTPATLPGAPTIGTATAGDGSASVSFTVPGSNGGSAITSYTVTSNPGAITASASGSPITVTGLTNGTAYTFSVTATNSIGIGPASAASNSVTPAGVPGAPTAVSATPGNGSASVSFTAPSNNGAAITGYTVTSSPGGLTGTGANSPISVSGLTNGTAYTFTVTASNSKGTGPASSTSNSVTPATLPGAPTISLVTASNASATVSFSVPSNGGSAITGYTVTSSPGGITGNGSASPITVTGLTNGTAYTFTVTAQNSVGAGPASAASNSVTPATVPGAPQSVSATSGNGSASVSFTAPPTNGAAITNYTVTSTPGGFTGSGTSSPITISGLINGTAYTFTVTATNSKGTGPASSASNSVTPATLPGAPAIGLATAGNASATVSFTVPNSNGGVAITSYTVTSNPGGITGNGSSSPVTVTGLTNGTAYTFTVTATNVAGMGPASAASNSVTPATVPGAPQNVVAIFGNGSAAIGFSAPASTGGAAITTYTVTSSPAGKTATGGSSPIVVNGLTNGTAYTFIVTATNVAGTGPASAASNSVTPATVPGAPQNVTGTFGNGSATVSFSPPASNGGAAITGYTVTSAPDGKTATGASSPITVTGLTNGTAYTFTVVATNAAGTGPASAVSNSVTPATVPGAPQNAAAIFGNGSAAISFSPPASNGGATITSYTVTSTPDGKTATAASSPITVIGLTNGTAYTFTVVATNAAGTGPASAVSNSVTPATVPGGPQNAAAIFGNGSAAISFGPPASNGGAAITSYTVTSSPDGKTATGASSPITVTSLTNGTAYTFTVTATNIAGTGPASAASNSVTPATIPGAPQNVAATSGDASMTVSFSPPVSNGGAAITSYMVTLAPGGVTLSGAGSPLTVNGLVDGTAYTATVTATNSVGTGPASPASNSVTPAGRPGAPTGVIATLSNNSAIVSFTPPAYNGGATVTSYTVISSPGGLTATGPSSPITVNGLASGTSYTFTVAAINSTGTGPASAPSNSVTPAEVPGAPVMINATAGNASATLTFNAPSSNGGAAITSYTVTSNPGGLTATGAGSPITVNGLTNGTAYTFTATATNSAGTGPASAASNTVTPATIPGPPQNIAATAGNAQATITFAPPASNGGSVISGYTVKSSPGGFTASGSASPLIVSGLTNGTAYTFTVTAMNTIGNGPPSAPSNSVTPQSGVPGAPQGVQAAASNGQATISFTAPANSGSSSISSYTVTASPGGQTATGAASPITLSGLTNGTAYTFTVTATNAAGTGPSSAASNTVTPVASLAVNLPSSFPIGMVGSDYPLQILTAVGGLAPYTFAITSGKLPDGLSFASPQFSGIPTASGEFVFTITVTDSAGSTSSSSASILINPANANLIISQSAVPFYLTAGSSGLPTPASVTVRSSVILQLLNYSVQVSPNVPWLTVTGGGTTPGSIAIAVAPEALSLVAAAAPYQTIINVTCMAPSPCAGNVQPISVSLSVTAPPPQLSTTNKLLSFETASANPVSVSGSLGLQNTGGGSLIIESVTVADNWLSVTGVPSAVAAGQAVPITVTANPAGLSAGYYVSKITINSGAGSLDVPISLLICQSLSMNLLPAGIEIQSTAGSAPGNPGGTFKISISGGSTANWTASVLPGSPWLTVSAASGSASAATPGTVNFAIDPVQAAGLSANTYYGTIRVTADGVIDSPLDFVVILNVAPAATPVQPNPSPAGLVFIATASGVSPSAQPVEVYASSNSAVPYQASAATDDKAGWLGVNPSTGAASSSAPGLSSVSVNIAGLAPGVYSGGVSYAFSSAAVRTVNVTLVVVPASSTSQEPGLQPLGSPLTCVPTKLVATQIGLVANFEQFVGWPTDISVVLFDDCGNLVTNAQVAASFSNGDPPFTLTPVNSTSAVFSGTWTPRFVSPQANITVNATAQGLPSAATQITGQVASGNAPVLAPNSTLHAFDPQIGAALAPGNIVAIYGSNLASGIAQASQVPLPTTLGRSSVLIGGLDAPLFYVAPGQINAQIPFELTPGNRYQVQVNNGGALSTPDSIQLAAVSPGIAALGSGLVIAQRYPDNSLVTEDTPAHPGDYLTIYLAGLGATDQPVATGAATPGSPLIHPVIAPELLLNGASIPIEFAGLTPGTVGLYQINFQVPSGTTAGDLSLVVSQSGVNSNATILPVEPIE